MDDFTELRRLLASDAHESDTERLERLEMALVMIADYLEESGDDRR